MDDGFRIYISEFNQQTMTVTFVNGSQIIFMAESFDTDKELNRFRGLEINGAGLDELNELQRATFYKVIERSGSWTGSPGCPIRVLGTCNPSGGWVKEEIYDRWKNDALPDSWAYVPAKITDNPHIPIEYIESLKANMPPQEYEIFVEGNWEVDLEGALFKRGEMQYFNPEEINRTDESGKKIDPDIVIGYCDIADEGDDFMCGIWIQVFGNEMYLTDCIFTQDNIDITIPLTVGKINKLNATYTRIEANNQGGGFVRLLRQQVSPEKVLTVKNTSNKHTRILMAYSIITGRIKFLHKDHQSQEYTRMMQQLFEYKKDGTSKHDDAPDAIAGLAKFAHSFLPHLFKNEKEIV